MIYEVQGTRDKAQPVITILPILYPEPCTMNLDYHEF